MWVTEVPMTFHAIHFKYLDQIPCGGCQLMDFFFQQLILHAVGVIALHFCLVYFNGEVYLVILKMGP